MDVKNLYRFDGFLLRVARQHMPYGMMDTCLVELSPSDQFLVKFK